MRVPYHPDPEIEFDIARDAAVAARFNRAHGIAHCPLCAMDWPRPPSSVSEAYVHIVDRDRIVCPLSGPRELFRPGDAS